MISLKFFNKLQLNRQKEEMKEKIVTRLFLYVNLTLKKNIHLYSCKALQNRIISNAYFKNQIIFKKKKLVVVLQKEYL